jgi:pilus assembly protein CpaC
MRRMSLVFRASWWCLLGLILATGAGAASAQDKVPALLVFTNTTKKVGMSKNQVIAEVRNENPKICRVQPVEGDPTSVLVTGLAPGKSRLTFEDNKKNTESIDVEVVDASLEVLRKEFLDLVASKVPNAQLNVQLTTKTVIITGLVPDQTSLKAIRDAAGNIFGTDRVTFALQLPEAVKGRFIEQIQRAIPGSKVSVYIDGGNIIVSGYAPDQSSIKAIEQSARNAFGPDTVIAVSLAGQEPAARIPRVQQVELEVIVAVVNRSEVRSLAANWVINRPTYFIGSTINSPLTFVNDIAAAAAGASANAASVGSTLTFGVVGDKTSFSGFLNALRTESLAKVLAEPRIVAMSGQRAQIVSGGETPLLTSSGTGAPSIEFKDFGTRVDFIPVVLSDGKIQLEIDAEVSNKNDAFGIDIAGVTPTRIPGFEKRSGKTKVQIEDGMTLAIGGLIQNRVNASTAKIPLLGDLPFLGTAFRTVRYDELEEEMLILVTPRLVDPMSCCQLPRYLPGRETRGADDFELFLTGIMEAPRGQREVCPDGRFVAAHKNGSTASVYPCGDNTMSWNAKAGCHAGHGKGAHGANCANGSCLNGVPNTAPASAPANTLPNTGVRPIGYDLDAPGAPLPEGPPLTEFAPPVVEFPMQETLPPLPVLPASGDITEPPSTVLPALGPVSGQDDR